MKSTELSCCNLNACSLLWRLCHMTTGCHKPGRAWMVTWQKLIVHPEKTMPPLAMVEEGAVGPDVCGLLYTVQEPSLSRIHSSARWWSVWIRWRPTGEEMFCQSLPEWWLGLTNVVVLQSRHLKWFYYPTEVRYGLLVFLLRHQPLPDCVMGYGVDCNSKFPNFSAQGLSHPTP